MRSHGRDAVLLKRTQRPPPLRAGVARQERPARNILRHPFWPSTNRRKNFAAAADLLAQTLRAASAARAVGTAARLTSQTLILRNVLLLGCAIRLTDPAQLSPQRKLIARTGNTSPL